MSARGELGQEAVTVPVLDKISHTRHEFNKTSAWQPGMVVKRGDRYQDVVAVDKNGSLVTVRDEEGKIALISPRELVVGDVELFSRSSMEVRAGDQLRFTGTPGLIIMPVTGATPGNITVLSGGTTATQIQFAIRKAEQTTQ